jgi:L-fucose isomerase-like protein
VADTCTIVETWAGVPLAECGNPPSATLTSRCRNGHAETTAICAAHAETAAGGAPVWCAVCAEHGQPRNSITTTIQEGPST